MSLQEQINKDFMTAFKAGEAGRDKKNFLGLIKGEIQLASSKPDFKGEETVLGIVKKMEKSLNEAATHGDESAKTELEYLAPYLPKMMERSEVEDIVKTLIVNGANNMGMIMKEFNSVHQGKADNSVVKEVALTLL